MKTIKRIAIIGNAGSGKSTLARKLHQILHIPLYHLDQYFWKPHWTHPNIDEYKVIHDTLCDQEVWIIDGMNLKFLDYRASKAEVIIFLDIPRYICLWRIFKRTIKYYGKETPSSAQKCPERFDWKFVKWAWDFKAKYPPKIRELLHAYEDTKEIYILQSSTEINQLLEKLNKSLL